MSPQLADSGIVARMRDYLERQCAWFETVRGELAEIEAGIDAERIESVFEADGIRAKASRELEREFFALKQEWDETDGISEHDVGSVRAMARETERLAQEIHAAIERAATQAGTDAAALRERLGEVRNGREWLGHYRQDSGTDSGRLDQRA